MSRIGYLEYADGHKSMGRLIALMLTIAGVAVVGVALTLIVWSFVRREMDIIGSLVGLATIGLATEGLSGLMKNWAKAVEAKATVSNQ